MYVPLQARAKNKMSDEGIKDKLVKDRICDHNIALPVMKLNVLTNSVYAFQIEGIHSNPHICGWCLLSIAPHIIDEDESIITNL